MSEEDQLNHYGCLIADLDRMIAAEGYLLAEVRLLCLALEADDTAEMHRHLECVRYVVEKGRQLTRVH